MRCCEDDYYKIAGKTRKKFENKTINLSELKILYKKYNPIKDIDVFVKKAIKMFPNLNCGLTTVYFKKLFPKAKIVNGKFKNDDHTFLLINQFIIDITADQYGGPKVYVGKIKQPYSL